MRSGLRDQRMAGVPVCRHDYHYPRVEMLPAIMSEKEDGSAL